MEKKLYIKYECPTHRNEDGTFREQCDICSCAPYGKMVLEPGVKTVEDEPQDLFCPHTGEKLTIKSIREEDTNVFMIGTKMTSSQIQADRKKRSSQHFNKEILPTLGKDEKLHHSKKLK